jgi:hypothetical protein
LKKYTTLPLAITQAKPEQGLTKYLNLTARYTKPAKPEQGLTKYLNLTARYTKPAKLIWLAVLIKLL